MAELYRKTEICFGLLVLRTGAAEPPEFVTPRLKGPGPCWRTRRSLNGSFGLDELSVHSGSSAEDIPARPLSKVNLSAPPRTAVYRKRRRPLDFLNSAWFQSLPSDSTEDKPLGCCCCFVFFSPAQIIVTQMKNRLLFFSRPSTTKRCPSRGGICNQG